MIAVIIGILILVVMLLLFWLLNSIRNEKNAAFSPGKEDKPLIKVRCENGYLLGYYVEGDLFKGKKYIAHKLRAEGTFFNGVQVGKGKEYYENAQLKYTGYFLNGCASGSGKLYTEEGRLKYEGHFENGYASGFGKLYDTNGHLKCEGNFARLSSRNEFQKDPSAPSGKCREYYENGKLKYEGDFANGLWHGDGKLYDKSGRLMHKGKFLYGKPEKK
jgi:hypothetical protein